VILNVSKQLFEKERRNRGVSIHFRRSKYDVSEINHGYSDVDNGEMVAFFNQDDYLEIALNRESAAKLLGLKILDTVRIEFNDGTAG
jgi:S-adenosylmethionine hydrolase